MNIVTTPHRMFARLMGKRKMLRYVFDIETWTLDARRYAFGCVIDIDTGERWLFHEASEARSFFEDNAPCAVYSHNMFGFDLWSLVSKQEAYEARKIAMDTKMYELTLNKVRYRDTVNLFPMTLSELGDALQMPKGETPEDYIKGNVREITEADIEYCYRDCEILVKAITDLERLAAGWVGKDPSQVAIPLTTASLSYRIWCETSWPEHWSYQVKKQFKLKEDRMETVLGVSCDPYFNQTAKEAYSGGRVQLLCEPVVRQPGIVTYDENSMFGAVQHDYDFPDMKRCIRVGPTATALDSNLHEETRVLWANVRLKATEGAQRFLPTRNVKKRLDWTQDTFSGWLAEPELKHALWEGGWELEEIRELNTAAAINPFRSHVRRFFDLKAAARANNDPRGMFYKLVLNSGYGKYGQRPAVKRIEDPDKVAELLETDDFDDRYELRFYDTKNLALPYVLDGESLLRTPDSQWFGFASFITSGARVELQKAVEAAGEHAKYVDTDCVHMSVEAQREFERKMPIGDGLGEWKQEQETPYLYGTYWEPKAYKLVGNDGLRAVVKHKGVDTKDRHGNWLPNAGDLTKPQTSTSTVKLYSALRRNLDPGVGHTTEKRSKRWSDGS